MSKKIAPFLSGARFYVHLQRSGVGGNRTRVQKRNSSDFYMLRKQLIFDYSLGVIARDIAYSVNFGILPRC